MFGQFPKVMWQFVVKIQTGLHFMNEWIFFFSIPFKNVIIDTLLILHKDILMQKNDHSDV